MPDSHQVRYELKPNKNFLYEDIDMTTILSERLTEEISKHPTLRDSNLEIVTNLS